MIRGSVNSYREAIIHVLVQGPSGQEKSFAAVVDTGFDGWLTLPTDAIAELELDWRNRGRAQLADGAEVVFDTYEATVLWDGQPRRAAVDCADIQPLVGMALLEGCELRIRVRDGGQVVIEKLSPE